MQCPKCNNTIPDNSKFCNSCGANLTASPTPKNKKFQFFKGPSDGGKGYAAIMTALMVFPATLCVAIDLVFHKNDGWCTYVVGAIIVAWIVSVFPALRITPAPITALICMFSALSYVAYIIGKTGQIHWFYKVGLPLFILATIFISVDATLIGAGKFKGCICFHSSALKLLFIWWQLKQRWICSFLTKLQSAGQQLWLASSFRQSPCLKHSSMYSS